MSASPVPALESAALQRARALLAEDRSLTNAEESEARGALERAFMSGDLLEHSMLQAVYSVIDSASARRTSERVWQVQRDAAERMAAQEIERVTGRQARWDAMPRLQKALILVADESWRDVGAAFARLAALLDERTALPAIPESYDPPRDKR